MSGEEPLAFDRLLNVRAANGATFDAGGGWLYCLSTLSGVAGLYGVSLADRGAQPAPLAVSGERVQYAYPSSRPGRLCYGADRGGDERTQLYLMDGLGRAARPLTASEQAIHHFGAWSEDGRSVLFAGNERDARYFDLFAADVESGERRRLWQDDGNNRVAAIEPGGSRLLVEKLHGNFEHELLVLDPRDGSTRSVTAGRPACRYLSPQYDPRTGQVLCLSEAGEDFLSIVALDAETGAERWRVADDGSDVDDFAVSPDGAWLVYGLNRDGYSEVRLRSLLDGAEQTLALPAGGLCYDSGRWLPTFAWSADSAHLALTWTTSTSTPDCWGVERASGAARQVTASWTGITPEELVEPELVHYPSFDGHRVPAFLFAPPGSGDPASRPALFFVHGGPESQLRPSFNPVVQYFARRGFVVLAPNVRGSTGYGRTYTSLDDLERRPDAVRDLAAGAEWLAASGLAHPRRIAVMGGSYGGYMVLAALTERPDLWAAGVDIVGIANFVTFLERTGPWRRRQRETEYGSLAHHRELLERLSPIHRVERIAAPLLVIHGANDPRVPLAESEQIVASLRDRGRPAEYLVFDDEGHGVVKIANRLVAYPRIAAFLEQHLAV
jgi:dipeptidyl aminopeptidase/acylaminoacyl peptidase